MAHFYSISLTGPGRTVVLTEFFKFSSHFKALNPLPRQGSSYVFRVKLDRSFSWYEEDIDMLNTILESKLEVTEMTCITITVILQLA